MLGSIITINIIMNITLANFLRFLTRSGPTMCIACALLLHPRSYADINTIDLGSASNFGVLAGAGITNTGVTVINGNVGSFPTATITGFGTVVLNGTNHGGDPVTQGAKIDLLTAFNNAAGRSATITYAPVFDLGGLTLGSGVYKDPTSFGISGTLTLDAMGNPNAVWIFQAGSTLTTGSNSSIILIGGAQAANIFWQIGSSATLGTNTDFMGNILAMTSITLATGATIEGRLLALTGAVTLDNNTVNVPVLNLVVSGSGTITVPVTVATVTLASSSSLTLATTLTVADGVFTVPDGVVSISGGNIVVPADFNKNGSGELDVSSAVSVGGSANVNGGALVVSGPVTVAGAVNVLSGALLNIAPGGTVMSGGATTLYPGSSAIVNGALQSPTVNVSHGSSLSGTGFVVGNVMNSGVVSPGNNGAGTLHVQGNFTQTKSGTLAIQLGSNQLDVSGHASLGGTLQINTPKGYRPQRGQSFEILSADGGVSGHFSKIDNPFPGPGSLVKLVVDYTGDAVFVDAVQNTFKNALSIFKLTPNQTATAAAMDSALNDKRQNKALDFLDNLDINTVPHQLDKIAPEELTSMFLLGFAQMDNQVLSVQQRMADIRGGSRAPAAQEVYAPRPLASEKNPVGGGKGVQPVQPVQFADSTRGPDSVLPDHYRYGFFVTASGDYASLGDSTNANGFNARSVGVTVGMDMLLGDHFAAGIMLGYARTDTDLIDDGSFRQDGERIALYATYFNGGFYTEGLLGVGYNSYDTRRGALDGVARGSTSGGEFDAYLGTGYNIPVGKVTITPIASLLYTLIGLSGFDERGSLEPLHIESQNESSLRSRLGVRASYPITRGIVSITPSASIEWQHEFLDDELGLTSRFANGSGSPFTVHGTQVGRDSALLTASVNVAWSRYACYIAYQADLGRKNYENQTVLAGFRVSW